MPSAQVTSYLRSHRLRSGMSQRELAELVGIIEHHQVSTHERATAVPTLLVALSYQAVFCVPVSELFPDLYETILTGVEDRLTRTKQALHDGSAKGHKAQVIARRLIWMDERAKIRQS